MKKKLNIILSIIIILSLISFIYILTVLPGLFSSWSAFYNGFFAGSSDEVNFAIQAYIKMFVAPYIMGFIFSLGLLILSIFLMVYINKADLQYLRENVFIPKLKEIQEKRKADKQSKEEEKRQQKIEELQKQIDELNKTDERP